ncbi:hypothetical protein LBMAG33_7360 [Candidatus Levyibacteriota bacterium]|nr:preprotein translocase subunit SecE [Candidatus Levybacteria bacterium]MSU26051.1 preprotein translocase subunit SecE [Candidatus Levybacteria bacterium]GDX62426.1 hypothetical protein LBMAG33_7360 [Candidatus Levybacteria bacterium]
MGSIITFLKETRDELLKVIWPMQKEVIRLTTLVIIISLMVGVFIGGIDILFTKLLAFLIK